MHWFEYIWRQIDLQTKFKYVNREYEKSDQQIENRWKKMPCFVYDFLFLFPTSMHV